MQQPFCTRTGWCALETSKAVAQETPLGSYRDHQQLPRAETPKQWKIGNAVFIPKPGKPLAA